MSVVKGSNSDLKKNGLQTATRKSKNLEVLYLLTIRYHSRFFVRVGHETTYASSGNRHFLLYHVIVRPTKIMSFLENKVPILKI